jgi:hypothetical protein
VAPNRPEASRSCERRLWGPVRWSRYYLGAMPGLMEWPDSLRGKVVYVVGGVLFVSGVIGLIGVPEDLGAWARLIDGVDAPVWYVLAYGVLVVLGLVVLREVRRSAVHSDVRDPEPADGRSAPRPAAPARRRSRGSAIRVA